LPDGSPPLSVVILAKDEAAYIQRSVASALRFADDVVVVDSGSMDGTQELALAAGARVEEQPWLGYSAQRNRGAELARHDWIFQLDADELVTADLEAEIRRTLAGGPDPRDGFTVQRRSDFLGCLLPNDTRLSKQRGFVRLYHRRHSGYDPNQLVHEEVVVGGRMVPLGGLLLHWRGETIDHIAGVFNRYASIEAEALRREGVVARPVQVLTRPVMRFLWVYVWKRAYRLGARGLIYAVFKSYSEFLRYGKLWESRHAAQRVIDPPLELYADPTPRRRFRRSRAGRLPLPGRR
jgi:glycosyltransferase involved in cell wall biosynthesis